MKHRRQTRTNSGAVMSDALDGGDLARLAAMTRLAVGEDEKAAALRALNDIVAMMQTLSRADVGGEDDLTHVQFWGGTLRMRDDAPAEGYPTGKLLENAPQHDGGCFLTPKVVE